MEKQSKEEKELVSSNGVIIASDDDIKMPNGEKIPLPEIQSEF